MPILIIYMPVNYIVFNSVCASQIMTIVIVIIIIIIIIEGLSLLHLR